MEGMRLVEELACRLMMAEWGEKLGLCRETERDRERKRKREREMKREREREREGEGHLPTVHPVAFTGLCHYQSMVLCHNI